MSVNNGLREAIIASAGLVVMLSIQGCSKGAIWDQHLLFPTAAPQSVAGASRRSAQPKLEELSYKDKQQLTQLLEKLK